MRANLYQACWLAGNAKQHFASQLSAFFNDQLAVTHGASDFAGRVNHQLLARRQVAVELPPDFSHINVGRPFKCTLLGDLHYTRVHRGLHQSFNDQCVAIGNFNALQLDVGAYR